MKEDGLADAARNLLQIPPLIHRCVRSAISTLMLQDPAFVPQVTKQQLELLIVLEEEGTQQVAEIGNKLHIAKAQMTQLLDKLAKQGLIDREPSLTDRRAINVSLSTHGRRVLGTEKETIRQAAEGLLARVPEKDLKELSASLQKVQEIVSKIDQS
jgi:DNA-binding MarR family transcriptional regulator